VLEICFSATGASVPAPAVASAEALDFCYRPTHRGVSEQVDAV
jgi:hypothetical protein